MARTAVVRTNIPIAKIQQLIQELPEILAGSKPDKYRLHKIYWGAVANHMFKRISEAYAVKSMGLADELGEAWPDLTPKTKAYKRQVKEGEVPSNIRRRLKNRKTLGMLTEGQDALWRKIFGFYYHNNKEHLGETEAKALAAQIAWTKLKQLGAKTKISELGGRKVPILDDTGRLKRSLLPGNFTISAGYKKKNSDQIYKADKNGMIMGTKVPYAQLVGSRNGKKLRPIWPDNIDKWINEAVAVGRDAVHARLATVLGA